MSTSAHLTSRSRISAALWRFQIERQSPLVAIVQVPGIVVVGSRLGRNLVPDSPCVTRGRFNLDHVSAKIGQDHGGARPGDET